MTMIDKLKLQQQMDSDNNARWNNFKPSYFDTFMARIERGDFDAVDEAASCDYISNAEYSLLYQRGLQVAAEMGC